MKKIIAILFTFVLVFSIAGCSGSTDSTPSAGTEGEESKSGKDEASESSESNGDVFLEPFDTSPTIDEAVLWDEQDVKITATGLEYSNSSVSLNLAIENNSEQSLNFAAGTMGTPWNAVNGYMVSDGYLNEDVEAGTSVDCDVSFNISNLTLYGIKKIADIQIGITVKDDDNNSFFLSPQKIETSVAGSYDYEEDTYIEALENGVYEQNYDISTEYFSTDKLYENNGISIVSEALLILKDDSGEDAGLFLEIDNQSEYNIYAAISDLSINDTSVYEDNWTQETMISGTKAVLTVDINDLLEKSENEDESLIENGLDNITFELSIRNENYEEALTPETITINFN